jgi:hypothetical protein
VLIETIATSRQRGEHISLTQRTSVTGQSSYVRMAALTESVCALIASALAVEARFASPDYRPAAYLSITLTLPVLWLGAVASGSGAY